MSPEVEAAWVYRAAAAPRMAWSAGEGRVIEKHLIGNLTKYDDAIHPVVVGLRVYLVHPLIIIFIVWISRRERALGVRNGSSHSFGPDGRSGPSLLWVGRWSCLLHFG